MRVLIAFIAALLTASVPDGAGRKPGNPPADQLIVPFPPGNALDTIARPIFDQVSKQIGQAFVFENRPGPAARWHGLAAKATRMAIRSW